MPKLTAKTNNNPYLAQPCDRCGSKRYLAKSWKEKTINASGMAVLVEYTQMDCSNKTCQVEFEQRMVIEEKKREVLKQKKDADTLIRKENLAKTRRLKKA